MTRFAMYSSISNREWSYYKLRSIDADGKMRLIKPESLAPSVKSFASKFKYSCASSIDESDREMSYDCVQLLEGFIALSDSINGVPTKAVELIECRSTVEEPSSPVTRVVWRTKLGD